MHHQWAVAPSTAASCFQIPLPSPSTPNLMIHQTLQPTEGVSVEGRRQSSFLIMQRPTLNSEMLTFPNGRASPAMLPPDGGPWPEPLATACLSFHLCLLSTPFFMVPAKGPNGEAASQSMEPLEKAETGSWRYTCHKSSAPPLCRVRRAWPDPGGLLDALLLQDSSRCERLPCRGSWSP